MASFVSEIFAWHRVGPAIHIAGTRACFDPTIGVARLVLPAAMALAEVDLFLNTVSITTLASHFLVAALVAKTGIKVIETATCYHVGPTILLVLALAHFDPTI